MNIEQLNTKEKGFPTDQSLEASTVTSHTKGNATMSSLALNFNNVQFDVVDRNNQPWLRVHQIGAALGYSRPDAVNKVYQSNTDEFADNMTALVEVDTAGGKQKVRIFSLRGCHLLAMFARTAIAKQFRKWVLDVLDKETAQPEPIKNPRLLLRNTIHAIAKGDRQAYSNLYNRLYRKFQVTSYKELNDNQCVAAIEFIKSVQGEYIARDKIEAPKPSLALCDGQHYVVAKDGVVLMHKVLSHDINDSFLKSLAQPTLDLQGLELLQGEIDYWQVRKALALVNGLVGQYQPYSHVRPMVNVLEATENMLRRLWTMIDESSTKVGILQAVAKTGKPLNEANMDTLAHIQALLHSKMMKLQMPQY